MRTQDEHRKQVRQHRRGDQQDSRGNRARKHMRQQKLFETQCREAQYSR